MNTFLPVFICGLPRSRTAWWATLLTWGAAFIAHDGLCPSKNETFRADSVRRLIASIRSGAWTGHSDAANLLIWRTLHDEFPNARWVVCKRDLNDVLDSCRKIIPDLPTAGIGFLAKELDSLVEELRPLAVNFDDITPITALRVADYAGIHVGPTSRVRMLCDFNIQIHPPVLQERLKALICQPIINKQTK